MSEFLYSPDDVVKLEDLQTEGLYSADESQELENLYNSSFSEVSEGEVITGTISSINAHFVLVDVGFKSEGIIERGEFEGVKNLEVGAEIDVFVESYENRDGQLALSFKRAIFMATWKRLLGYHDTGETVKGICQRRIKGGMVVNLDGIDAFLPGSQIDVKPIRNFDAYIGKELEFKIVKVNHVRKNIVVSSRALIEESLSEKREEILKTIEVGATQKGLVKNITDFGVFIDLGGVDGLLHITDLSWGRVNHPSEIVKLDEEIDVKILDYDPEKKRISLGLKQLQEHPWENIEKKFPIGGTIQGQVVSIADYGAFIEIDKGIEGLIHISEMSWSSHVKHPSQVVKLGDKVDAVVLNIEEGSKKISLGLKQLEPDPWDGLEEKFPIGSRHRGKVRNLTAFGAFVELEEGIDGLVHISDMSWTKKIKHPGEIVKKGEELDVVVTSIDRNERRIALGHKQTLDNPWEALANAHPVGSTLTVPVLELLDKGLIVEMPQDLIGFIPVNQLGVKVKKPADKFAVGDELTAMIIEMDEFDNRLILSIDALTRKDEKNNIKDFNKSNKSSGTTIGDILKAAQDDAK